MYNTIMHFILQMNVEQIGAVKNFDFKDPTLQVS